MYRRDPSEQADGARRVSRPRRAIIVDIMSENIPSWATALFDLYGDAAEGEAHRRAIQCRDAGEVDSWVLWKRVLLALAGLQAARADSAS